MLAIIYWYKRPCDDASSVSSRFLGNACESQTVIEFLCPNGHRIRCQATHAGRAARCPKCGIKFRVPESEDLETLEPIDSDSKISRPDFTDSDFGQASNPALNPFSEEQIEFLCPNGHRLHGSTQLQGRSGQCPECGSRFRIPTYEEVPAEEPAEQELGLGRVDGGDSSAGRSHELGLLPSAQSIGSTSMAGNNMALLVERLWQYRPAGSILDLEVLNEEAVTVDRFLPKLSQETGQCVFLVKDGESSLTLIAVSWDSVKRAHLRGLTDVPQELSE